MNTMTIKQLVSALLVCMPAFIVAQQSTLDRNVTVEREYQPVIEDAGKITTLPEVLEPVTIRQPVIYDDLFNPLPLGRYLQSLPMTIYTPDQVRPQNAFIRMGMGNYFNTLGELSLPLLKTDRDRLDMNVDHLGTFGRRKLSQTRGNLDYNRVFDGSELYAGLGVIHRFYNYYGSVFNMGGERLPADTLAGLTASDSHFSYKAQLGFRSLPDQTGFRQKGHVSYEVLQLAGGRLEKLVHTQYGFNSLMRTNRYGVDFELQNMLYEAPAGEIVHPDYSLLSFNPYFLFERTNFSMRLGANTVFSFETGRPFSIAPDVKGEFKLVPEALFVYGGVGGGLQPITNSRLMEENIWVNPSLRVQDVYTPFKPYVGLKVKVSHFLMLDGFVEYHNIKDQYFFVNDVMTHSGVNYHNNLFDVAYSDAELVRAGGRISFQSKNQVSSSFRIVSNQWTVADFNHAWMKPAVEADWRLDVKANPNLTLSSNFFYEGKRYARLGSQVVEMESVTDLNLSASYFINSTYSAFIKLNNVLNKRYEQFIGYDVQGFNFLLGGAISF
jgi:hypothetical protein